MAVVSIPNFLKNLKYSIQVISSLTRASSKTSPFQQHVSESTAEVTEQARSLSKGEVGEDIFGKLRWYMTNMAFMGHSLARLSGTRLSSQKEKAFMYLGTVIAFTDLLIDDYKVNEADVQLMLSDTFLQSTEQSITGLVIEDLFRLYLNAFYEHFDKDQAALEEFKYGLRGLMEAQVDSAKQFDPNISEEEVLRITAEKGGYSIQLCCAILPQTRGAVARQMHQLGKLDQMLNDANDLPKDARNQIITFVRFKKNYNEINNALIQERINTFEMLSALPFETTRKEEFMFLFYALSVAVTIRVGRYAKIMQQQFDFEAIAQRPKSDFDISNTSFSFIGQVLPRLLMFTTKQ